ncbi:helix-turn-helix transcriptional regulator [Nocardioides iriomotensis]|uniref:Helix-turn-helix transcriptional regulator n=1 Tax=Nocardioides iriomotensis TaxID=715784 RepID=A0A4Q5IYF0_9ACTN|nr:helix-turn-helix transcriptional regulator [Nocardioides iriomotensis]
MLVGRDAELADLVQRLHRVREDGASLVLLSGPRGAGRSTLLATVAGRHDGPVRRAVGARWEAHRPGAVLAQLAGAPELPPDAVLAAGELLARVATDPDDPVLLVVDDAHHADPHSLQVLSTLVRHHPTCRVLVLLSAATGRGEDVPADVAALLASAPDARLSLAPLDRDGLATLASARGVALAPWLVDRLHRHTGGLPGAVVSLLEELPRSTWNHADPVLPAPQVVAAATRERLTGLDPAARRLVEAAAVLAGDHALALAGRLADLTDTGVWPAVEAATRTGLVELTGPPGAHDLVPADAMVAAAVRAELGEVGTAALHTRAAALVDDPVEALRHRVAATAGPDPQLADELAEVAEGRAAAGAWGEAAGLLTAASRLTEDRLLREARLTRAVDALVGAGEGRSAMSLIPEVESLRETPLRNAVLGYLAILRGRATDAEGRLRRAWDLVNVERDPAVAALISTRHVLHALSRCRWGELVAWADRAVELAGPDDPAAVEATAIRGLGLVGCGRPDEALRAYADVSARVRHGAQAQRVRLGSGWLHVFADELDEGRSELESAVPTDHLGGSARISLWARAWLARAQLLAGEWDQALRTVVGARDLLDTSGIVLARPLLDWTAVQVHALRGDLAAARAALQDAESAPQDYEVMVVPTLLARAALAEAQLDHEGVVRALTPLRTPSMAEAVAEPGYWPWADLLATSLVALGRADDADAVLRPHEERALAQGHRSTRCRLARARARLHAANGDLAAARASFEASLEAVEELPLRLERAGTTYAYGQVLRRAGKRREADTLLTAARDEYVGLGAETYVARCDRELKAGGVHASRGDRGPEELTPQEEAVTELVARGLSNREVAAELYLSTKTVQYHLTRVYAKLGVRSRTELAASRGPTS